MYTSGSHVAIFLPLILPVISETGGVKARYFCAAEGCHDAPNFLLNEQFTPSSCKYFFNLGTLYEKILSHLSFTASKLENR